MIYSRSGGVEISISNCVIIVKSYFWSVHVTPYILKKL